MFLFRQSIPNEKQPCLAPEVAFSPDGTLFAVTYQEYNELRLYDASTKSLLRTYRNPDGCFGEPHALLFSENHILVSNRNYFTRPTQINVYRIDSTDDKPVGCHITPFKHLVEPHSMALSGDRLLVTYCEGEGRTGGLVCYRFDDQTGEIGEVISIVEDCFHELGDPKGVCFIANGTKAIVSFNSLKPRPLQDKFLRRIAVAWYDFTDRFLVERSKTSADQLECAPRPHRKPLPFLANGFTVFDVSSEGVLSTGPTRNILRENFCRLENVKCVDNTCVVSDTINDRVYIYDLDADPNMNDPKQIINEEVALPHGVSLSPDKKTLLITNFGLRTWKDNILWQSWARPRKDMLTVFEFE